MGKEGIGRPALISAAAPAILASLLLLNSPWPAAAAPSGALPAAAASGQLAPVGYLPVVTLTPSPRRTPAHPTVVPLRTLDPVALQMAKQRAAARLRSTSTGTATTSGSAQVGLFNGLNQPGISAADEGYCCVPPDTTGAIGPSQYIEIVNQQVRVYDRSLTAISQLDLTTFVGGSGLTVSDPMLEWDQQGNRWLYSAVAFATGANYVLFGWSKTADPTDLNAGWCRFGVFTGNSLNDYPKLGHDDNFLTIGSNVYDTTNGLATAPFVTANIWAIPKPALNDTSCTAPSQATYFADATHLLLNADGTLAFTPVPANTTDASASGYIVGAHSPLNPPHGAQNKVMVWHLTLNNGAASLVQDGDITVDSFDIPTSVPQPNNAPPLDSLDARLTQAVARVDPNVGVEAVWTQQTIAGASGRAVARWYEFLPGTLSVQQEGQVASTTDFIFNAAISPSYAGNDAAIFYNRGSSTTLPLIAALSRRSTTPLGTMDAGELVLATSADVDQDLSCSAPYGPPCRWGDYAGATPDPTNAGVVWGSSQVTATGPLVFGLPQWGTQNFAVVTGSPDFSLSASPASQTVAPGGNTSYAVTITPTGGFSGQVTLDVSGLPSGASGAFAPNPATTSSTLTVTISSATPVSSYPLTIAGTSGSLSHTTSVTLVVSTPDFSLSASPASQTVAAGGSTSYSVTITPTGGFSGQVTLAVSALPSGASASFVPNPATASSTLSVTTSTTTPVGSYPLTITGTSGTLSHTTAVTLVVNTSAPPDFSLTASPSSQTASRGGTVTYAVTITAANGFNGLVTLAVTGLPAKSTATFNPNPATSSAALSVTGHGMPRGTYTLTITGTSGSLVHSTSVTLTVS